MMNEEFNERFFVKDLSVLNLDEKLQDIAIAVANKFHLWIVTSAYRPGDTGVHGTMPVRGVDLRCSDDFTGKKVEAWVNSKWGYDHDRPDMKCAIYHNVGKGWHVHLQTHPNTFERKV